MVIRTVAHLVRRLACGAVVLWLAVAVAVIEGYPTGAPGDDAVCADMVPKHSGNLPQDNRDFIPVTIATNIRSDTEDYTAVRVTVRAKRGRRFRGFLLQARHVVGSRAIGSFTEIPAGFQGLDCFGSLDSAVTHTNRRRKSSVSVTWQTFDRNEAANVVFVATIVESFDTFWVNVSSDVLFGVSSNVPEIEGTPDPMRLAGEKNKTINTSSTPTSQNNDTSTVDDGVTSPTVSVTSLNVTQPITNTSDVVGITNSSETFSSAETTSETPANTSIPSTEQSGLHNSTYNSSPPDVNVTSVDDVNTSTGTPVNVITTVDYSNSTSRNISITYTSESAEVTPTTSQENFTIIDTVTSDFVRTGNISTENNASTTVFTETDINTTFVPSTNSAVFNDVSEIGNISTAENDYENMTSSVTTSPIQSENSSVSMTSLGNGTTGYSNYSLSLTSTLNTQSYNETDETMTSSNTATSSLESTSSTVTSPISTMTETSLSSPSTQSTTTSEPEVEGNTTTVNDTIEMSTAESVTIATTNDTINSTFDTTESRINSSVVTSTSEIPTLLTTQISTEPALDTSTSTTSEMLANTTLSPETETNTTSIDNTTTTPNSQGTQSPNMTVTGQNPTSPSTPLLTTQDDIVSTVDMMTSPQTSISSSTSQSTNSQTVVRRSTPQETQHPSLVTTASVNNTESLTMNISITNDSVPATVTTMLMTNISTTNDSVAATVSTILTTMDISTNDSIAATESTMSPTMHASTTNDSVAATESTMSPTMNVSTTNDSVAATVSIMSTGMPVTNSSVEPSEATTADDVTTDAVTSNESLLNSTATSANETVTTPTFIPNNTLTTPPPVSSTPSSPMTSATTDALEMTGSVTSVTNVTTGSNTTMNTTRSELTTASLTTVVSPVTTNGSVVRTTTYNPTSSNNRQSKMTTDSSVNSSTSEPGPISGSVSTGQMETSMPTTNDSLMITNSSFSRTPSDSPVPSTSSQTGTESEITTESVVTTMQPEPNSTSVTMGKIETSSSVTNSSGIVTNMTTSLTSLSPSYTPTPTDPEMTTDSTVFSSTSNPVNSASRDVSVNSPLVRTSESNAPSGETTTAQPIVESNNEVLLRFRIGQRPFTEDLTRPESAGYQSLADEVVNTMWDVYRNTNNLDSINLVRFLRGSVIPEVQLVFGSQLDDSSKLGVVDVLYTTVQTSGGQLGNFTVDSVSAVDENGAFETIDACFLLPCPPGAYCFVDSNDGQCWLTCFRNDDYCLNGGACVDPTGDATVASCRCVNNFEGTRCEIEGEPIDTNTGNENLTLLILAVVCGILALLFLILVIAMLCWCVRSRSRKTGRFEENSEKMDKWRQNSLEREESFRKVEAVAGTSFTKTDEEPQKPSRMLIVIPSDDESSGSGFYLTDSDSDSEHLIRPKIIEGGASFPYFDNLNASIPDLLCPVADYEMDIMNHMANRPLSDSIRRRSVSFSDIQQVITDDDRIGFENFSFGDSKKGSKGDDSTNDNFQVRWDFKVGESAVEEQETAA